MANGVDFSNLRKRNLFPEVPDMSGGTMSMGSIDFGPDAPTSSGNIGEINLPEADIGSQHTIDPRPPVNPAIGGPGSRGQMTAEELMRVINQIYTPETTSRDRFNRLLDAAPEREDPSFARRLVAAGMGFGQPSKDALGTMEGVMYAPHARNMQDWTAKAGPFREAATIENTANVNERSLAGNVATNVVNQNRYEQQNEIAQQKADSERIRAQAYALKNAGWSFNFTGPEIIATKPTGERMNLGPTGKLSEFDKVNLEGQWDVKAAEARGTSAMQIAQASQQGQNYRADASGWIILQNPDGSFIRWNERTGEKQEFPRTGAGGQVRDVQDSVSGGGGASATANRVQRNMKWQQVFDESGPEIRKWMIPPSSPNGDWNMRDAPPATVGWFPWSQDPNPDVESYNRARQALGLPPMASVPPPPVEAAPPVGNQPIGGSNVVPSPPVPQGQPGMVGGQQRYMQPPIDFSQQPSTRTGVGGVQQPLGTPTQAQPQPQGQPQSQTPLTKSQADQMIASGQLLIAMDAQGKRYIVPNTQAGIEDALRRNLRVQTPQGR